MPATFDLPLEALRIYTGTNPKPSDFNEFWDRGVAEMTALGTAFNWEADDFGTPYAECGHLTFGGVGGARIHARMVRPRNSAPPGPALLWFHGLGSRAVEWVQMLPYAAAGLTVAAMDCRGQGGRSEDVGGVRGPTLRGHIVRGLEDAPERMLYRNIFLDAAQLARILMERPEVDPSRIATVGRSQGGALALACAALEPRIFRVASVYPYLCDYRRVYDIDLARDAYGELQDWFRYRDPRHLREAEIFERLGYIDVQHLCGRIQGEVLFATGLMDEICPPSTQFAAFNRIGAPKWMDIYPDFGHEDLPGHPDRIYRFLTEGLAAAADARQGEVG
ncbi:MAG: alpha/beta fold hydrolase [Desulfococcaceae bacterium]